jgi:PAS domain S-box-containing protein
MYKTAVEPQFTISQCVPPRQLTRRRWLSFAIGCVLATFVLAQGYRLNRMEAAAKQAAASSNFWRAVIDNIEAGIIVADAETNDIMEWSAGAERMTGWSRGDVVGKPLHYLLPHDIGEIKAYSAEELTEAPLIVDGWLLHRDRVYLKTHIRAVSTRTIPARLVITLENLVGIKRLHETPLPAADPTKLPSFVK